MTVRKMTTDDIPEVAQIEKQCFHQPWSAEEILRTYQSVTSLFTVAEEGRKVVGYVGMYLVPDEGYIINVAVSPLFRKKGVATQLIAQILEDAKEEGVQNVSLEVRKSNQEAIRLYEKIGFESVGIRKNFYELPPEDAIIMWKYGI
ncbi:ribosomal protein S18-alanine N-acetyltransferase [Parasporobacterium paucivorans]|uniref:[Ribosomal protein bS18]-alanine N-acetyltransferase n=1 Tax=Parasporobacterium paucivorans DSM 15970 TaxID=1122934 RepID=A0A1M6KNS1_9FIRM|nr:ribosomal protein S18-alanine N-acetyltransferase [Parasporobacterium paucivorans]SHJ60550.1 ribosomal-protein-alanine N-acetyltransferase [Parasporobacterium paucivorans DSM 15970]